MPKGQKFSQRYLKEGKPTGDSLRMRRRISAFFQKELSGLTSAIARLIQRETGSKVPFVVNAYSMSGFFEENDIRDFLDSITIIYEHVKGNDPLKKADKWKGFVNRVFREENVSYRLDDQGGVQFFVDEEFEKNKQSVIENLNDSSQLGVLEAFMKSYDFLNQVEPDTASSIRSMFEAIEILYKSIIGAKPQDKERLNKSGVNKKLVPIMKEFLKGNETTKIACGHMLDGLVDWIEAGHMYRHGQSTRDGLTAPSMDYAVFFISQGASYIRYLLLFLKPN